MEGGGYDIRSLHRDQKDKANRPMLDMLAAMVKDRQYAVYVYANFRNSGLLRSALRQPKLTIAGSPPRGKDPDIIHVVVKNARYESKEAIATMDLMPSALW